MKAKLLLPIFLILIATDFCNAQAWSPEQKTINLGLGFGSPYWGSGLHYALPFNPVIAFETGLGGDDAFLSHVGFGGSIAYSGSHYDVYPYDYHYSALYFAVRGAYHFDVKNDKFDPYAGLGLGYVYVSVNYSGVAYADAVGGGLGYSLFGGARYALSDKFGLYGELGFSSFSFLTLGLSIKI